MGISAVAAESPALERREVGQTDLTLVTRLRLRCLGTKDKELGISWELSPPQFLEDQFAQISHTALYVGADHLG